MARFVTNPVAMALTLFVLLAIVAARPAFGTITGGALSQVPGDAADWWRLHVETRHPIGTGTDVPAPAYVLPFALLATIFGGSTGAVISTLMLLADPVRRVGCVAAAASGRPPRRHRATCRAGCTCGVRSPTDSCRPRPVPGGKAASARSPSPPAALDGPRGPRIRRPRPRRPLARCVADGVARRPGCGVRPRGVVVRAARRRLVFGAAVFVAPRLLRDRDVWGPPVAGLLAVPVLLAPWLLPLITTGSAPGLLLEAGRLPGDRVDFIGLSPAGSETSVRRGGWARSSPYSPCWRWCRAPPGCR